jgi:uncharacterized protein
MTSRIRALSLAVVSLMAGGAGAVPAQAGEADFERALGLYAGDATGKAAAKAVPLYKKSCAAGFAPACTEWGHLRYFADGVPMDIAEAVQAYKKGCELGAPRACIMLARAQQMGIGMAANRDAALATLTATCEKGGPAVCWRIARMLGEGVWLGSDADRERQFDAEAKKGRGERLEGSQLQAKADELKTSCGSGDNAACLQAARLLREGHPDGWEQAAHMFELACTGGIASACYERVAFSERHSVKLDPATRTQLLARGCEMHDGSACASIGFSYANQYASKENIAHAISFLRRGCVLGSDEACTRLGDYLKKEGPKNVPVMPIFERACEFDTRGGGCNVARVADGFQDGDRFLWTCKKVSPDACVKAGILFATGQGVRQVGGYFGLRTDGVAENPAKALDAFQSGCDQGAAASCGQLALMRYQGKGVAKDEVKAVELWKRGCEAGDGTSCSILAELNTKGLAGFAKDSSTGLALYEKGCSLGSSTACLESAWRYWHGDDVVQDLDKASALFAEGCKVERASHAQVPACCNHLRNLQDDKAKLERTASECPKSASSCVFAAQHYADGDVTARDTEKAAKLYGQACVGANAKSFEQKYISEGCLGAALYSPAANPREQEKVFQRACAVEKSNEDRRSDGPGACVAASCLHGDSKACIDFGLSLFGNGTHAPHRELALAWVSKGCASAAGDACASAVESIRKTTVQSLGGDGEIAFARRVLKEIRRLHSGRCEAGDAKACFALSTMVRGGFGGSVDANEADALVKKSCDLGSSDACIAARGKQ